MDSGSSGSMQSSSGGGGGGGGDEAESISSFFNHHHHPPAHFGGSISNQQQPLLSHHQQPTFFDLHSQNLDTFPQSLATPSNANLQYNNEMVWPRGLRSETTNYVNFGNIPSSSSLSLSSSSQSLLGGAHGINQAPLASSSSMPPLQSSIVEGSVVEVKPNVVKNPKKRTRASRRAPTTILTTDTNNFRQMVQEFTGIPASPFARGSPFSRGLDLFSTSGGAAMRAGQLEALGSLYPLRPSPQKPQLSPFIASSSSPSLFNSSMINAIGPNSTNNTLTTTAAATAMIPGTSNAINTSTHNFSIPSNLSLPSMQNQLLNFQPLLQQQPTLSQSLKLNPLRNEPFFNTSMPSGDELGMGHQQISANLGGFSNQEGPEARQVRNDDDDDDDNRPRWRGEHVGSLDHGHSPQNAAASNFKLNTSSSSEFYPDKVLENASSGGGTDFRNYN